MFKSIYPYDQRVLAEFSTMPDGEIQRRLTQATTSYASWKNTTFQQRSGLMRSVANLLRKNKDEYAKTITWEMGKVFSEAQGEVEKCAAGCEFFAAHAEKFLDDKSIKTEGKKSYVTYQPTGAVLAVMPWNFPLWQVFRFAAPVLMAGNVGLLKHSSNVTQCSLLIERIFIEAGFPLGVFQSLIINNEVIEKILEADIIQGVALTGSEKAGSIVSSLAAKNIKRSVLELGGSDPFIVLEDANLEKAVEVATRSRMQNAGQSCIAAKRFIVVNKIKDEFLHGFERRIKMLKQGDPFNNGTTTGPLARIDLAEALEKQLKQSVKQGGRLVTGGTRSDSNFEPALIENVGPGITAFDEETFGPLACVTVANNELDAIRLANVSRYGLGASVWSNDLERAERVALKIESGSVFINSLMRSDSRLPFGGIKKSGYGRELAEEGIKEFVNTKAIYIE